MHLPFASLQAGILHDSHEIAIVGSSFTAINLHDQKGRAHSGDVRWCDNVHGEEQKMRLIVYLTFDT